MKQGLNCEVHFHQQEKVSVFIECSEPPGEFRQNLELLLFSAFSLRQMLCLGAPADPLAAILYECHESRVGLGEVVNCQAVDIIEYPGAKGRKRFDMQLRVHADHWTFNMKARGFGFLARGVNYYAPTSVLVLLRFLAARYENDDLFLKLLGDVAHYCGVAHGERRVTPANCTNVAGLIVEKVAADHILV